MKQSCSDYRHLQRKDQNILGEAIIKRRRRETWNCFSRKTLKLCPAAVSGVSIQGRNMLLGNKKLMDEKGVRITLQDKSDRLAEEGKTPNVYCYGRRTGRHHCCS